MKCPFCQQELYRVYNRQRDTVIYNCTNCYFQGDGIIWEYLIDTKKKLDICLNLAEEMLRDIDDEGMCSWYYEEKLNKIKTPEQKDKL